MAEEREADKERQNTEHVDRIATWQAEQKEWKCSCHWQRVGQIKTRVLA
jgi:hypothetical protein